jgi:hypothetical protein
MTNGVHAALRRALLGSISILSLTCVAPGGAQTADHLKCFKVKDPQMKALYTADLSGLTADSGCVIKVPAQMACVPSSKTNVQPTPPGGGGTGSTNGFFCYKAKCPKVVLPVLAGSDQFGDRTVTPRVAKLLCAPMAGPPTTSSSTIMPTTTSTITPTTTTSSSTTTTLRFVDNGNGTVTDHQTGLMWEKKVAGTGCVHCVDDTYSWSGPFPSTAPDGTAFTSFLVALNGGATGVGDCVSDDGSVQTGGFADHCDWRLPTIAELRTILLAPYPCGTSPCIDPVFGPTVADAYRSATTDFTFSTPYDAWDVDFGDGQKYVDYKGNSSYLRAVRGGS